MSHGRAWFLLAVGATLWFGLLTNWTWASPLAGVLHAAVALIGGAIPLLPRRKRTRPPGRFGGWAARIALSGGVVATLGPALLVVPPLTLAAFFGASEIANQRTVQVAQVPGGRRSAVVRYRGVGAYAPGNGKLFVSVRYPWLPGLERQIAGPIVTDRQVSQGPFVQWLDARRLRIEENGRILEDPGTRVQPPLAVALTGALATFYGTAILSRVDIGWPGDEPVTDDCAKWEVWGVRPGLTVATIGGDDPDLEYRRPAGSRGHLWDVVLWSRRFQDGRDLSDLAQWRFGYEGTLVTAGAMRSSRVVAVRMSAGAVALGADGAPVVEVPVIGRVRTAWGPPTVTFDRPGSGPVAENWSPPRQHAEVWVDESCGRLARVSWGDGPYMSSGGNAVESPAATHRYHTVELFDLRSPLVRRDLLESGRE